MRLLEPRARRLLASAALAMVLALGVAGCQTTSDVTGSIGNSRTSADDMPRSDAQWRESLDTWGARYRANSADPEAAINYARALRATDQRAQAVAVLEQATIRNPHNMPLLGEYGRALAAAGSYEQALDALGRAHTPDNPDWRILNAQGAVLDQMGRNAEAQRHYSAALKIVPDEPSVLSNLGLSYVLTKDLKRAEITLRRALAQPNANPKVRQNLALVLGLRGKFDEADRVAREGLPADEAAANVSYLRQVLAQRQKGGQPYVPPPNPGN
ncbi:MAG: tetratricopeptide repeat protein [Pseudolabrys sp.]|jgi:Flp pilus assembly protein TadD